MPKLNVLKVWIYFALIIIPNFIIAQHLDKNTKNVFIVTIDGLRWQEIFRGTDSLLIHDINYTEDTTLTKEFYWEQTEELRRKRLMPFFWNTIAKKGNIYGNRNFDNQVTLCDKGISITRYLPNVNQPYYMLSSDIYLPYATVSYYYFNSLKYYFRLMKYYIGNYFQPYEISIATVFMDRD